jgi:hypothetical protein
MPLMLVGWSLVISSLALAETPSVEVAIARNGQAVRPGAGVLLYGGGKEVALRRREGRLLVSVDASTKAAPASLQIHLKGELIRVPLEPRAFQARRWTITIADTNYSLDYQWAVPKGVEIRRSCFLVYEFAEGDGPFTFHPDCRTKR